MKLKANGWIKTQMDTQFEWKKNPKTNWLLQTNIRNEQRHTRNMTTNQMDEERREQQQQLENEKDKLHSAE